MSRYDLTPRLIPFLDRHMILPLLEFLEEKSIYAPQSILQAKLTFANSTKMLDLFATEYRALHGASAEPPQLEQRRQAIYTELHELQSELGDLLTLLTDELNDANEVVKPAPALMLRENNQFTAEYLAEHYNITQAQIELLYRLAKFNFEIGRYRDAADQLFYYRELTKGASTAEDGTVSSSSPSYWSLWGKCAGEILMANMEIAYNDLQQLTHTLDTNIHADQLEQLQQRSWILHWSLFVFWNLPNGRNLLIEFFMQDKMLNTIQMNAPHLLRYLTAAIILNRRRKNILKDLIKILLTSTKDFAPAQSDAGAGNSYTNDPLLNFILSLCVDYNFQAALQSLTEARAMLANDFFLSGSTEKEIVENCRVMLFEVYCSVHTRVSFQQMIDNVDLSSEIQFDNEGEIVISANATTTSDSESAKSTNGKSLMDDDSVLVSMVRACHVSARIDSYHKQLFLTGEIPSIYSQVVQRTNNATFRTQQLAQGIAKRIQQKRQQQEAE